MTSLRVKRLCLDAMLLGVAMMLSYLEAILPLSAIIPLPGAKLGLANICIMLCFYTVSPLDALTVSLMRISLTALLFGNLNSFAFALTGGMLAYLGMWLCKALGEGVSFYGISVLCAALHNFGQCLAGSFLLGNTAIFTYLPLLLIFALIFGGINGAIMTPISKLRFFKNA